MQLILCLFAIVACAYAAPNPQFIAAEQFDSAIVRSDRLGGNFAYSSVEGPAHRAYAPYYRSYARPATVYESRPYAIQDLSYTPQFYGGFGLNPYRFY